MTIKAIFWDIDGVLVESEPLHVEKIKAVSDRHGVTITDEDWPQLYGIGDKRIWEWLQARGFSPTMQEFLKECEDYYMAHADTLKARPGMRRAFNEAARRKLPQAAVSSGVRKQVDANLEAVELKTEMLFSLSADEVTKTKPDPEPYNKAFERLSGTYPGLKKEEMLVIEDSPSGACAGKAAGMVTILWRLSPDIKCDAANYIVDTPAQLLALVKKLTAPDDPTPGVIKNPFRPE